MGLFGGQFSDVVEWQEYREDQIFWKWPHDEIKKGSRLILRTGQDAVFLYNGKIEGIFQDEGSFDIESDIIPFLTTLKSFRFGFNTPMRAEVVFINTKEITCKWGTKNEIYIPAPNLPGGIPVRAFGTFNCRVGDHDVLMEKIAGVQNSFTVEDIRTRIMSMTDQLLMKWISKEGKDMFNLQANAAQIARGIESDLDMELCKIGVRISGFTIANVSYPREIQDMIKKAASQQMAGDMGRYQQFAVTDAMANGKGAGSAADMAGMSVAMAMGQQMANQMLQNQQAMREHGPGQGPMQSPSRDPGQNSSQDPTLSPSQNPFQSAAAQSGDAAGTGAAPNFCPNCGTKVNGAKFCPNCGQKLV